MLTSENNETGIRKYMDIKQNISDIIREIESGNQNRISELADTPRRVENAYNEFFDGYDENVDDIVNVFYESQMDDLIILKNIQFESHCEHHMVPIVGEVSIGYIPNGEIIGASKLARLVDCFAHRLQLQERLTIQIAETLQNIMNCKGVAVLINAEHFCISRRGIKKPGVKFVTRYFTGLLKSDTNLRKEFLDSCIRD